MATRSLIAIKNENGTIESIYCNSDGYPSHNGDLLLRVYNTEEKARELINLGWCAFLDEKLYPSKEYDYPRYEWSFKYHVKHSFESPQKGVSTFYHRDRGDKLRVDKFENEDDWLNEEFWCSYRYLWKNGAWYIDGSLLTEIIVKCDE